MNLHSTYNEGWRKKRAKAVLDKIERDKTHALLVDPAKYLGRGDYSVAPMGVRGALVIAATLVITSTRGAE
ncbi:hypothetical protein HPB50_017760 [Hyalomma asiaticum]|uniref:Uncharacterized protein n=1 Tax=Hyalomma asiaticum TaxID=266040 RepID=A0ACB7SC41_HYAAI|nr:hypothetical protein HPB50_017760 [Hyalomma asiaticum]